MLNLLTQYLLQFRKVFIPHVGAVEIVQTPAKVDVVDKLIYPPQFFTEIKQKGTLTDHQLQFLASSNDKNIEDVKEELETLGRELQEKIDRDSFNWEGIGTFTSNTTSIPLTIHSLQPLAAEKVQRTNVQHQVLVGDQHVLVHQEQPANTTEEEVIEEKKSTRLWIAGVLLAIAVLVIIYFLYKGNFTIYSSGLKRQP
ncbi:MAG: hypothetical protein ACM3VS_16675 [Candidatus Dadabacteria bacterium]